MSRLTNLLLSLVLLSACTAKLPTEYKESSAPVDIYPNYIGVTVPVNMAPLHFSIENEGDDYVTLLSAGDERIVLGGKEVCPSLKEWQRLAGKGDISVRVFTQQDGKWTAYQPFPIYVSGDSIDPYISYRLISPSYVAYENLTLQQRCLENYDELLIYGNMINSPEEDGQCINCHFTQGGNPERFQFHVRQGMGGTVIANDGDINKVDLKVEGSVSGGVYPAWHPTEKLIAYSTNKTGQSFHTIHLNKIEVQDTYSDLILYDVEANVVHPLECDSNELDCFPAWSPDGRWLYYCSAHYEQQDTSIVRDEDIIRNFRTMRYNLYRRPFDLATLSFGERQLVYDAMSDSLSATEPKISPDGRWLMFTRGSYGIFHIWHGDADLCLIDLNDSTFTPRVAVELNSDNVEAWHSWSHDGRWVVFSSRREDGNYTRPFFAHHDGNGHFTKPFCLPQDDPEYHRDLLFSYNVPEFMSGRVTYSPQDIAECVKKEAKKAKK